MAIPKGNRTAVRGIHAQPNKRFGTRVPRLVPTHQPDLVQLPTTQRVGPLHDLGQLSLRKAKNWTSTQGRIQVPDRVEDDGGLLRMVEAIRTVGAEGR